MAAPSRKNEATKAWTTTIAASSVCMLILSLLVYYSVTNLKSLHRQEQISSYNTETTNSEQSLNPPNESGSSSRTIHSQTTSSDSSLSELLETNRDIHQFNRHKLLPLIKSLVTMDYFRYVKLNLNRPCKLWCDADKCNLRDCKVKTMSDPNKCPISNYDEELATVNTELTSDQLNLVIKLFECNDNDDHDSQYVDLLINPERFTGYSGESAHRIWRAIYEENCFLRKTRSPFRDDLCYEERLFYESISGLHTSINIHLCAEYPSLELMGSFGPNLEEFLRRFKGHNNYLENLYKLYLLELKALLHIKPYLSKKVVWPDAHTKKAVQDLLTIVGRSELPVTGELSLRPSHISHELALHFRNITTTIMDCVACDKCKLWGKVQLRGLGVALKVLSVKDLSKLYLNQQEIVSFVNAIARLSHSIRQLEEFRDMLESASQQMNLPRDSRHNNPTLFGMR